MNLPLIVSGRTASVDIETKKLGAKSKFNVVSPKVLNMGMDGRLSPFKLPQAAKKA